MKTGRGEKRLLNMNKRRTEYFRSLAAFSFLFLFGSLLFAQEAPAPAEGIGSIEIERVTKTENRYLREWTELLIEALTMKGEKVELLRKEFSLGRTPKVRTAMNYRRATEKQLTDLEKI